MIISNKNVQGGFSLVEIMIAVAIMAMVATAGITLFTAQQDRAKKQAAQVTLRQLRNAIDTFHEDTGEYPQSLRDLVTRPSDDKLAKNWQDGGYLSGKKVPKDPWQSSYQYQVTPEEEHPYKLYSYGKNKKRAQKSELISAWKE